MDAIHPRATSPSPGDSTITRAFVRLGVLRRLSYCCRAIAELEALPHPTLTDQVLRAMYRDRRARLAAELGLDDVAEGRAQ